MYIRVHTFNQVLRYISVDKFSDFIFRMRVFLAINQDLSIVADISYYSVFSAV